MATPVQTVIQLRAIANWQGDLITETRGTEVITFEDGRVLCTLHPLLGGGWNVEMANGDWLRSADGKRTWITRYKVCLIQAANYWLANSTLEKPTSP